MSLYGRVGYSHGATNLVTVMSTDGLDVAMTLAFDPDDIRTEFYPDMLPQYHERRAGGLERFIEQHAIAVLEFKEWTAKKAELGDVIYR